MQPGQNNIEFIEGQDPQARRRRLDRADVGEPQREPTAPCRRSTSSTCTTGCGSTRRDPTRRSRTFPERFFAAGEEKTTTEFPPGYGYPYKATDHWVLNYMLHNLTPTGRARCGSPTTSTSSPRPRRRRRASSPRARSGWTCRTAAVYPVFDVLKGTGTNGTFTYPDHATDPYHGGAAEERVDRRPGRRARRHRRPPPPRRAARRPVARPQRRRAAHLFRPMANYYEPAGAVSWDVTMTATNPTTGACGAQGRHAAHLDDLRLRRARRGTSRWGSWSCGWPIGAPAAPTRSRPRSTSPATLTHGHLPENDNHGGTDADVCPTSTALPDRPRRPSRSTSQLRLRAGRHAHRRHRSRRVKQGQSLTFNNDDAPVGQRHLAHDHRVQGAVQRRDRHRLPARQRRHPVRLGRARHAGRADRGSTSTGRHRPTCRRAPTRTSAGSTRSCAVRSS